MSKFHTTALKLASITLLAGVSTIANSSYAYCAHDNHGEAPAFIDRSIGTVQTGDTVYFENKVDLNQNSITLRPSSNYKGHNAAANQRTDDTQRVQKALFNIAKADGKDNGTANGGTLYLRKSNDGTSNIYRLARINVPSNIRIIVDPEVTLMMIGGSVPRRNMDGSPMRDGKGKAISRLNQHMFAIGNSEFPNKLNPKRTKNVEITSSRKGEMFTVDQRTEFPLAYKYRRKGQLRAGTEAVTHSDPQEYGITATFAAPFFIGYAENISVSDVDVLDNYTYLPPVSMFPDSDTKDGIIGATRHSGAVKKDANGKTLKSGMLIDNDGNKVTDMSGYKRNETYGRDITKGAFVNIKVDRAHGGFGLIQIWAGNTVYMRDMHGTGGITVRLEPGAGIENISRSGPGLGDIHTVEIQDISIRDGFGALWLNPHSKDNYNIRAHNISAYDSAAAIIMDKTSQNSGAYPDLYAGAFKDVRITGNVHFARESKEKRAEVGYIPTLLMHIDDLSIVQDIDGHDKKTNLRSGKPDGKRGVNDLPAGPSGNRWYLIDPIAPILAINQLSDRESTKQYRSKNHYQVDMSGVTFTRNEVYPISHKRNILYRDDMTRIKDLQPATGKINN